MQNILEMEHITKDFPGVRALDDVNFKVKEGEIHCLVGENGAGKSTLMKVLSGVYKTGEFEGKIIYNGELQEFKSIRDSEQAKIAIIYQELALIPEMSIYENIFLGHEIQKGGFIDWNETIVESEKMLKKVNLNINPDTKVIDVGVGTQQLIEIAKALSKDVKLLILDEPTAALTDEESENLLTLLEDLKAKGVTSIMITHKLKEVLKIADTITVLRDGQTICSLDHRDRSVTEAEIIRHMVGRTITDVFPKRELYQQQEVIFEVKNLEAYHRGIGRKVVKDSSLKLRKGEVIGIAGLMGAGRTELALSIFGNPMHYDVTGELYLYGKKINIRNPKDAIKYGLAYVTEDRKGNGLNLIQDIKKNITIANIKHVAKSQFINQNEEIKIARDYKDRLNIKTPSIEQTVENLSGGNQQKVSLGKWLFTNPNILILDEPTRGIDVGAKFEIYTLINQFVAQGLSIILISSELPELLGMADRIYVMNDGQLVGDVNIVDASQEKIMKMATQ